MLLPAAVLGDAPSILSQRLVWAHSMMCFPLDLKVMLPYHPDLGLEVYGANYPLEQEYDLQGRTGKGGLEFDIADAKAAGVDGFYVDVFTGNCEGYMATADKVGGFLIAPCIDMSGVSKEKFEDTAVSTLVNNCRIGAKYKSAARVGDAFVVFDYGSEMASPEQWIRIIQRVRDAGYSLYFVGALNPDGDLATHKSFPPTIAQWLPAFDAGYSFGGTGIWWDNVLAAYNAGGKPFYGGMMPGYNRVGGGYTDMAGTALYRRDWHRHIDAKVPWVVMATWNDLSENTHILPTADLNDTRSDITAWFSAKLKGTIAWKQMRLYLTTPKFVYPGQPCIAEALVLNGDSMPVRVQIRLVDEAAKAAAGTSPVESVVDSGEDGSASVSFTLPPKTAGRYYKALAVVTQNGRVIATECSAPILTIDPFAQPAYRTMYNSIPARNVLLGTVKLAISGNGSTMQASVVVPNIHALKFVDLLHNGELVRNFFDMPPYTAAIPRHAKDGTIIGGTEWGWYVSRVIDNKHLVAFSNPVYIAPKGDLRVTESYAFDEGTGTSAADSSFFRRTAIFHNAMWGERDSQTKKPCVALDGVDAHVDLPLAQGPATPMAFTVTFRPHAYKGAIYCDSGGMWLTLSKNGTPVFIRRGTCGWVTAEGRTVVPLDAWTTIRCSWTGSKMEIETNGKVDGGAACGAGFGSFKRSLGCNPFSYTDFWNGDIASFKIELIGNEASKPTGK